MEGILIKKVEFGDFDYILTYFTKDEGIFSVISKNAKKSRKRFVGKIELFTRSYLDIFRSKKDALPFLMNVDLEDPVENIRSDIWKTAHASYWAEIIYSSIPFHLAEKEIYDLFMSILINLDQGNISCELANIYFIIHFLKFAGFDPELSNCASCGDEILKKINSFKFRLDKGGILCNKCSYKSDGALSGGNIKQLLWLRENEVYTASKLKLSAKNLKECSLFLNDFIKYNLAREFNSLKFIEGFKQTYSI